MRKQILNLEAQNKTESCELRPEKNMIWLLSPAWLWPSLHVDRITLTNTFCNLWQIPLGTPSFVRPPVRAKNLDQLYNSIYASQTHITIHIPKAHDTHYPLMPPGWQWCADTAEEPILLMRWSCRFCLCTNPADALILMINWCRRCTDAADALIR